MNARAVFATFVAAIGATLGLASTSAMAAKPAPPNPCIGAQSRDFPSVVFTRQRTTGGHVYYDTILADATGQCQQTVFVADGFASSYPASDVNLRRDATGQGFIVRGGGAPGLTLVAAHHSVSFDASGVPLVQTGAYSTVLALADLSTPVELAGWSKYVIANPRISPDGSKILVTVAFRQGDGTVRTTFWTCPFNAAQSPPVTPPTCQMVYAGAPGGSPSVGWGGGSDSIYIVDASVSGPGRALSRLQLATSTLSEVWNLGTMFVGVRGYRDVADRELVAVYEAAPSGCSRVLVADIATCSSGGCTVLNGAGSPARTMSWLPDGRMVGEGQSRPNRKGQCTASGSIVTFGADDPNGSTTILSPAGSQPDGAGGG
jgi:hypothetical protein